jgi:hypothetical protein
MLIVMKNADKEAGTFFINDSDQTIINQKLKIGIDYIIRHLGGSLYKQEIS